MVKLWQCVPGLWEALHKGNKQQNTAAHHWKFYSCSKWPLILIQPVDIWQLKEINSDSQHRVEEAKFLLKVDIAAWVIWIANAEQRMTAHLWACPCGGLTHTEHWLVLDTIQPADCKTGATDPSHHGDVAVSEEAKQKMIHGEGIGKWRIEMEKKKKPWRGEELGCLIICDRWCLKSSKFILFSDSQRCTTWLWGSREGSSPACEPDRTDSPQTDWLTGCSSQPVSRKNKKNVNCYLCWIFLAMRLCQSTTLIQTLRSHQQYIAMKFGFWISCKTSPFTPVHITGISKYCCK